MDRLRIGLLGAGRMGRNHARVFSTLRYADLVGIYDPVAKVKPGAGTELRGAFDTLDELLDSVDAVSIATPTPVYFDLASACLCARARRLRRKPFTETLAQAEELVRMVAERADRAGRPSSASTRPTAKSRM